MGEIAPPGATGRGNFAGVPGEFSLIDLFLAQFPRPRVRLGPGDDCALIAPGKGDVAVTTDAVVQDVHFSLPAFSLEDVGHKALAVNLSDLAAMGARPAWFLVAIAMPRSFGAAEVRALGRGMAKLARAHRIQLVGGNFSAARELSVTITAAGEVPRGEAMLRSGGRPGDALYVSGTLGDARLGVELLMSSGSAGAVTGGWKRGQATFSGVRKSSLSPFSGAGPSAVAAHGAGLVEDGDKVAPPRAGGGLKSRAVLAQKRPTPRIALGLIARRFASAALDLSDGLSQDAGHLAEASHCQVRLDLPALPLSSELRRARPHDAALFAAAGGEDYQLLLAVPPARQRAFERACVRAGEAVTRIGTLQRGRGVVVVDSEGRSHPGLPGHDHFQAERAAMRGRGSLI